jgi:hypothetical protein
MNLAELYGLDIYSTSVRHVLLWAAWPKEQISSFMGECRGGQAPRRLDIRWVPMPAGPETVAEEFPLYRAYQSAVHGEAADEVGA